MSIKKKEEKKAKVEEKPIEPEPVAEVVEPEPVPQPAPPAEKPAEPETGITKIEAPELEAPKVLDKICLLYTSRCV